MAANDKQLRAACLKPKSLFDLPPDFFDSCRLLLSSHQSDTVTLLDDTFEDLQSSSRRDEQLESKGVGGDDERVIETSRRWTCNICKSEFDSLFDQRSHFKSDLHRLNVKLSIAGKNTIKEEEIDELNRDSIFDDFDVSSISGSEDEFEKSSISTSAIAGKTREGKQKLYIRLHSGDTVSMWRTLIMDESEDLSHENCKANHVGNASSFTYVDECELIRRLKLLVREPRDKSHLRIVLLLSGGHFAGCVFDGHSVVAHKTFHRYVVRAKAGRAQSAKDGTGKTAHSAGSSLRRHNEAALKKEIQELLDTWRPYIDSSSCIFIYAPSKNRQIFFDGEKPQFGSQGHVIRHIPLSVHRPTLKESKRIYNELMCMSYELEWKANLEEDSSSCKTSDGNSKQTNEVQLVENVAVKEFSPQTESIVEPLVSKVKNHEMSPCENETTPLHEAAKSGDVHRTLELLEQGLDPCIKDARGRTPYMVATEKEVRNTFRRYMALNLDKWDWHAANVPSPLTKEMEDSQAAKQAEKEAKRKAKAKELKKLRKAKEKAKAQAAQSQNASAVVPRGQGVIPVSAKQLPQSSRVVISKEEEQRRALAAEREKRAAAAERRIAALNGRSATTTAAPSSSSVLKGGDDDIKCSCCDSSLAGKVPFHRYNYKYCSTSCMHVHREMLEDE